MFGRGPQAGGEVVAVAGVAINKAFEAAAVVRGEQRQEKVGDRVAAEVGRVIADADAPPGGKRGPGLFRDDGRVALFPVGAGFPQVGGADVGQVGEREKELLACPSGSGAARLLGKLIGGEGGFDFIAQQVDRAELEEKFRIARINGQRGLKQRVCIGGPGVEVQEIEKIEQGGAVRRRAAEEQAQRVFRRVPATQRTPSAGQREQRGVIVADEGDFVAPLGCCERDPGRAAGLWFC